MKPPGRDEPGSDALHAYYGELASHPDPARRVGWRSRADQCLRFAVCASALPVAEVASVLDVGCGDGALLAFLRARRFGGRYVGVDVLPGMVARARAAFPGETFLCGDIAQPEWTASLVDEPYDLVVACGTFSLRRPDYDSAFARALDAMWRRTAGALALILPATRARTLLPGAFADDDVLAYHEPARLRRQLSRLSPYLVLREDFLPTDVAAYVYRDASPAHADVLRHADLPDVDLAWLLLQRGLARTAVELLTRCDASARDAVGWLRLGQAQRALGQAEAARCSLERALELDPTCLEARLELDGM